MHCWSWVQLRNRIQVSFSFAVNGWRDTQFFNYNKKNTLPFLRFKRIGSYVLFQMEKNTGGILTSLNEIHMLKKWCNWHERIYHCRQLVSTKWKFNCKKKKQSRLKKCVMFLIWNTARKWNKYVKYSVWLICNNP